MYQEIRLPNTTAFHVQLRFSQLKISEKRYIEKLFVKKTLVLAKF